MWCCLPKEKNSSINDKRGCLVYIKTVKLNQTPISHGKKEQTWRDTYSLCKHLDFSQWPQLSTRTPLIQNKDEESVERHAFVHFLLKNNLWSRCTSVCFREAATNLRVAKKTKEEGGRAEFQQTKGSLTQMETPTSSSHLVLCIELCRGILHWTGLTGIGGVLVPVSAADQN